MILLDTNVLSALMRREPEQSVIDWLDRQPAISLWTTSVTVFEIRFGLAVLEKGRRRAALAAAFERLLNEILDGRVADFDRTAAVHAADLSASLRSQGRSAELRDTMIAGIALSTRATLATRNIRHFDNAGIRLIDPWAA